jgi:hypothetical protein
MMRVAAVTIAILASLDVNNERFASFVHSGGQHRERR